ncbi:MAG: histidine--tRNA ligase [Bdellovibrionales bacterium]|nr:histidine--tRNA ligase [Bdellovibrionales bacterium]
MALSTLKGMQDILPSDIAIWQKAENDLTALASRYGFDEIRTPILEPLELYARGVGEHTDIVQKEMFSFVDQGGVAMCARPEGTASVVRSYLEHNLGQEKPLTKLFYIGPLFRHERPQKGRYRQFHQFGVETIGKRSPSLDVELILMMIDIAKTFGIDQYTLEINSLGDKETRKKYRDVLIEYFSKYQNDFSEHEKKRLKENPLRLLDSKNPKLVHAIKEAPSILDYLSSDSKQFFEDVVEQLNLHKVEYAVNPAIVRGMDYYCDTAFELKSSNLGAQDTIIGGGRYDGLSEQLGGSVIPATGFALGLERLLLSAGKIVPTEHVNIIVMALDSSLEKHALTIADKIREVKTQAKIHFLTDITSMKSGLRAANKYKANHVLILGEDEWSKKSVLWKNFDTKNQEVIAIENITHTLKEIL